MAAKQGAASLLADAAQREQVEFVCRCTNNRAAVRLLMTCVLVKMQRPEVDTRKPYTEIGSSDSFSGRSYDESCLTPFINKHRLPCNSTTAFLTPAFRNINRALTTDVEIVGRPRKVYIDTLQLLEAVQTGRIAADTLLTEALRLLLLLRDEQASRIDTLLSGLRQTDSSLPLSVEGTIKLIEQHLALKNASRVPVLIVAAAYQVAGSQLGERVRPLHGHNAADQQTGALGDVEIMLQGEDKIVTCYEMKMKHVTREDITRALDKIAAAPERIDNYIFITTDIVTDEVVTYAAQIYEQSGGVEMAVLDCIGFLRHFLHLFHRLRGTFLDTYQALLLAQPDSAVSPTLKEAFLLLRQTAERLLALQATESEEEQYA